MSHRYERRRQSGAAFRFESLSFDSNGKLISGTMERQAPILNPIFLLLSSALVDAFPHVKL